MKSKFYFLLVFNCCLMACLNGAEATVPAADQLKWGNDTSSLSGIAVKFSGVQYQSHIKYFSLEVHVRNLSAQKMRMVMTMYSGVILFVKDEQGKRADLFQLPMRASVWGVEIASGETRSMNVMFPADIVEKVTGDLFATVHGGFADGKVSDPISPPIDVAVIKKALIAMAPESLPATVSPANITTSGGPGTKSMATSSTPAASPVTSPASPPASSVPRATAP